MFRNEKFARRIYADLQNSGIRCWFAPEDLKMGARIRKGIDQAVSTHEKLLLILSEDSIKSQWVEQEVEAALEQEREEKSSKLFPIKVDNTIEETDESWAKLIRRTRNIGDFTNWQNEEKYQQGFKRLLDGLVKND